MEIDKDKTQMQMCVVEYQRTEIQALMSKLVRHECQAPEV